MQPRKSVIILSEKSSGSSILQDELCKHPDIKHVSFTEHFEHETLYWLKAACMLERDKADFFDNEPKFSPQDARAKLIDLLQTNVPYFDIGNREDWELVRDGWEALSTEYAPTFLEKSPHHLQNWAALEAMSECLLELEQRYLVIFLIRHPMAMLYSAWQRWQSVPEQRQWGWYVSYTNMLRFMETMEQGNYVQVKYEEFVERPREELARILEQLGLNLAPEMGRAVHPSSKENWRLKEMQPELGWRRIFSRKSTFADFFVPDEKVKLLAEEFGYSF